MLAKILPIVLLLVGSGAGVGAGMFLRPPPEPMDAALKAPGEEGEKDGVAKGEDAKKDDAEAKDAETSEELDYVKMNNQFVVPVVKSDEVAAMVVMSLSLEVTNGASELIFRMEPKLRDSFLQVLFDHANIGGFDGAFTNANNMAVLRGALREAGQQALKADTIKDVLILEIARQDY
ncbi:MAG: flagellar basal body-associated FliL family protein [Pseudomonadota bacterium]